MQNAKRVFENIATLLHSGKFELPGHAAEALVEAKQFVAQYIEKLKQEIAAAEAAKPAETEDGKADQ